MPIGMNCDYCKKRLRHPKIVHAATGAYHPDCLDKLHAATEGFGSVLYVLMEWNEKGRREDVVPKLMEAILKSAKPMAGYLKHLADNARAAQKSRRPSDEIPKRGSPGANAKTPKN